MKISILFFISFLLALCTAEKELHGSILMNRGLDFRNGAQIPEDRMRSPLFQYTFKRGKVFSPPGRPDLRFKVPDQTVVTPQQTHLESKSSDLHFSLSQATSHSVSGFNFGISINAGKFGGGAKIGVEWGNIRENLRQSYVASTKGLYKTTTYSLMGMPYLFMPRHEYFAMVLNSLPARPTSPTDLEYYRMFLTYYGGFFMYHGIFGGQIKTYSFLNQKIVESRSQSWLTAQISLHFNFKLFNLSAGGHHNRSSINIDKEFLQNSKSEEFFTGGIRQYQTKKTLKEWDNSVDDAPGLLTGNFRPISDFLIGEPVKKKNLEWIIKTYSETGELLMPPPSLKLNSRFKIPGYEVIGSGFDPTHMQTRLSVFNHDVGGGFNNPTVWTNPFYKEYSFMVPSSIYLRQNTHSIEKNYTDVSMSRTHFETEYSRKWTSSFALGFGRRTTQVYRYYMRHEFMLNYKITKERQLSWYDLSLNPSVYFNPEMVKKYMNPTLKKVIKALPRQIKKKGDLNYYKLMIKYWGTHLVIGTKMGGKCEHEVFFNKEILETHSINKVMTQSGISLFGILNFRNYDHKNDKNVEKWFKENSEIKTRFVGGRYRPSIGRDDKRYTGFGKLRKPMKKTTDKPWDEFVKTIRSDPGVLKYDIVPLTVLIRDATKRNILEAEIKKYHKKMSEIPEIVMKAGGVKRVIKKTAKKESNPLDLDKFLNDLGKN